MRNSMEQATFHSKFPHPSCWSKKCCSRSKRFSPEISASWHVRVAEISQLVAEKSILWDRRKVRGEGSHLQGVFSHVNSQAKGKPHSVSRVNTWPSCSYPESHKVWSTQDRAWRRGKCRVYGIVREEFFSWINSHVVDVLKVARRGDQTGVMMRERIRGTLLSKTTERESNEGWLYRLHQQQQSTRAVKHWRTARQQSCSPVNAQVLTLSPPVLWAPSLHGFIWACCPCCC